MFKNFGLSPKVDLQKLSVDLVVSSCFSCFCLEIVRASGTIYIFFMFSSKYSLFYVTRPLSAKKNDVTRDPWRDS